MKNRNKHRMTKNTENKREREKQVVELMIRLYCKKKHRTGKKKGDLCEECRALKDYAAMRTDHCPFMETKTFCSNCRIHCYKPEMREKIREVMKFGGPRMILYHPLAALRHVMSSVQEKKRIEREEKND